MPLPDVLSDLPLPYRLLAIAVVTAVAFAVIAALRRLTERVLQRRPSQSLGKARTVLWLVHSVLVFSAGFLALGFVLQEMGVPLGAYLASTSIIALAVGFGSQGLVQDVVAGLTLVFADLVDIGDMIEVGGQPGVVQRVGIRFLVLRNYLGADVYIPNRTIDRVVNYHRGYVRALADVQLFGAEAEQDAVEEIVRQVVEATNEQFAGIFVHEPSIEGRIVTAGGKTLLRVKFRIWPGQGAPLETTFRREVVEAVKRIQPTYEEWMVSVTYEVERKPPEEQVRLAHGR